MKTDVRYAVSFSSSAKTWFTPSKIQQIRIACLLGEVPTCLQDQHEALLELMCDTGFRRAEVAVLDADTPHSTCPTKFRSANQTVSFAPTA